MITPSFERETIKKIYNASDGYEALARAHDRVESEEGEVQELKKRFDAATARLAARREEFDAVRAKALEFCPALESGYGVMKLTETVGIKDGRITVIPIEEAKRVYVGAEAKG